MARSVAARHACGTNLRSDSRQQTPLRNGLCVERRGNFINVPFCCVSLGDETGGSVKGCSAGGGAAGAKCGVGRSTNS